MKASALARATQALQVATQAFADAHAAYTQVHNTLFSTAIAHKASDQDFLSVVSLAEDLHRKAKLAVQAEVWKEANQTLVNDAKSAYDQVAAAALAADQRAATKHMAEKRACAGYGGLPVSPPTEPEHTIVLTDCGSTGLAGPTQEDCNSAYGNDDIEVYDGYQVVTIRVSGDYHLEVTGARGGHHGAATGGSGAQVNSTVSLQASDRLVVVVGQIGWDNPSNVDWGGGGGGGSFVAKHVTSGGELLTSLEMNVELVAAAGGGAGFTDRRNSGQALGGRAEEGDPSSRANGGNSEGGAGYRLDGSRGRAKSFLTSAT